ncbi:hypothetical protein THOM_2184 [Trachipleistophora hominis]|uniref:Uncharacterized protein n=1 Tax=Trachipleistophora hominis TaxID=72359 RepID=L7JVV1_TRAHO|nr:hypothetical protein THOM_2184 [Trachipleistophora hominis]
MCVGLLRKMFINCRKACRKIANFVAPSNNNKDDIRSSEEERIVQRSKERIVGKRNREKSINKTESMGAGSVVIDSDISSMSGISESKSDLRDERAAKTKKIKYSKKDGESVKEHNRVLADQISDDRSSLVTLSLLKCEEVAKYEDTDNKVKKNVLDTRNDRSIHETNKVSQISVLRNKIPFKKNENYRSSSTTESSSNISLLPSDNEYEDMKPTINFKNKSDYSDLIENYENSGEQKQIIDKMKKFLKKCDRKKEKQEIGSI